MNKFIILLWLILFFKSSKSEETQVNNTLNISKYFDEIVIVLKGMSQKNDTHICSDSFEHNKSDLITIIQSIIQDLNQNQNVDFTTVLIENAFSLLFIDNIFVKCRIIHIIEIINKFIKKELIKEIGKTVYEKSEQISKSVQNIQNSESKETKLIYLGKIISLIFNFYVK